MAEKLRRYPRISQDVASVSTIETNSWTTKFPEPLSVSGITRFEIDARGIGVPLYIFEISSRGRMPIRTIIHPANVYRRYHYPTASVILRFSNKYDLDDPSIIVNGETGIKAYEIFINQEFDIPMYLRVLQFESGDVILRIQNHPGFLVS